MEVLPRQAPQERGECPPEVITAGMHRMIAIQRAKNGDDLQLPLEFIG